MKAETVRAWLEAQGVQGDDRHVDAAASTLTAVFKTMAEPFSKLSLEAEPSAFSLEQRRLAP